MSVDSSNVLGGFLFAMVISVTSTGLIAVIVLSMSKPIDWAINAITLLTFVPLIALMFVIHYQLRRGRRRLAIGMAIFVGIALLLQSTCAVKTWWG